MAHIRNSLRLDLIALGIKTRAGEGVLDLGAYIREHDARKSAPKARKASPGAGQGQAEAVGGSRYLTQAAGEKKIDPGASGGDFSGQAEGGIDFEPENGCGQIPGGAEIGQPGALDEDGQEEKQ